MTNQEKEQEILLMLITLTLVHRGWYDKHGVTVRGKNVIEEDRKKKHD